MMRDKEKVLSSKLGLIWLKKMYSSPHGWPALANIFQNTRLPPVGLLTHQHSWACQGLGRGCSDQPARKWALSLLHLQALPLAFIQHSGPIKCLMVAEAWGWRGEGGRAEPRTGSSQRVTVESTPGRDRRTKGRWQI